MISGDLKIFRNVVDLTQEAASKVAAVLRAGIHATGSASLVLSGGNTPRAVYELLGSDEWRGRVDWPKVHLFWGDERAVPPTAPDSNYRMASESMIRKIPIPAANVHRIPAERPPQEAALLYQTEIRRVMQLRDRELPRFTIVLLGLGEDGHIASLFPGSAALQERVRLATENYVERLHASRITLTLPVINNALSILLLVSGKEKAGILRAVKETDVPEYPANMIQPTSGVTTWMVDADAASLIHRPT